MGENKDVKRNIITLLHPQTQYPQALPAFRSSAKFLTQGCWILEDRLESIVTERRGSGETVRELRSKWMLSTPQLRGSGWFEGRNEDPINTLIGSSFSPDPKFIPISPADRLPIDE